jgi:hypothetical protein
MGTYHNGHSILSDVRDDLNENNTGLLQGTDTSGKFSNAYVMKSVNRAQRLIYGKLSIRDRNMFLTSMQITGVNSVYALPWDFGLIRRFEDDKAAKVYPLNIDHKPRPDSQGSQNRYFRQGNNLILTQSGINLTYRLWYYRKPLDLDQGAAAGIDTLASTAKAVVDYYNNNILENETDGTTHIITAYTAARVATLDTGLLASGKFYGTVSNIPDPFHHLIAPLASMFAKADHPVAPEKPSRASAEMWRGELDDAILAFAGRPQDVREEDVWSDNDTAAPLGINIPGQGYPIF